MGDTDSGGPAPTRLQGDGGSSPGATRFQGSSSGGAAAPRLRTNLPPQLIDRLEPVADLSTHGGQADLLLVRDREADGDLRVLKYYRFGAPPHAILEGLSAADRDHVVEIYAFSAPGAQDTWELLEYCEQGSLREMMAPPRDLLARIALAEEVLDELAPAIEHLATEHRAAHRDLKPENVLVRTSEPLDLVLADFGIARTIELTKNFTSNARSVGYASPEAISGQFSIKTDWWSLGMILAEILLGHHLQADASGQLPSEQQMSVEITTTVLDLSAVDDERWRLLLGGLITSNPDNRWAAEEVRRWREGESPALDRGTAKASSVPRRISPISFPDPDTGAEREFRDPVALANAMASSWETAAEILAGHDRRKLAMLRDFLRSCDLEQAERLLGDDDDPEAKLVRLLTYLDPQIAPTFRGLSLDREGLLGLAAAATSDEREADTLTQIYEGMVLRHYATETGERSDYAEIDSAWRRNAEALPKRLAELSNGAVGNQEGDVLRLLRARLLVALIEPRAAEQVKTALDQAAEDREATEREWFADLMATRGDLVGAIAAEGRDGTTLADAVTVIALWPIAGEEARRIRREQKQEEMRAALQKVPEIRIPPEPTWTPEPKFRVPEGPIWHLTWLAGILGIATGGFSVGIFFAVIAAVAIPSIAYSRWNKRMRTRVLNLESQRERRRDLVREAEARRRKRAEVKAKFELEG